MQIKAADLHLVDLDEFTGCEKLKVEIEKSAELLTKRPNKFCLDLRNCWIDYGFSHLYLDCAIQILLASPDAPRELNIHVSVDLGEREFMAALLFPQSKLLAYKADMGPSELARLLNEYCLRNQLRVSIISSLPSPEHETRTYRFGVEL
jgi:hypothetical protein